MAVQISGNDITVPRDTTVTRNLTVGGVLTYEDVTNVDSVGLVTARTGIEIGARPGVAASISVDGNAIFSGITTVGGNIKVGGDMTVQHSGLAVNLFESTDNHSRLRIQSGSSSNAQLEFGDQDDVDAGEIRYDHVNDNMAFHVGNNTERVRITGIGSVGIGTANPTALLDIGGNTDGNIQAIMTRGADKAFQIQFRNETSSNNSHTTAGKFGLFRNAVEIVGMEFLRGAGVGAGSLAFTNTDGETLRINSSGSVTVGSGITLSPDGNVFTTGVSTFSSNVNIGVGTTGFVSITPDAAIKLQVRGTSGQDVLMINTQSVAGDGDTFANIRGDNRSGIRIRGGGSYDGGAIELAGGLRDSDPGIIKFETGTGSSVNERVRITSDGKFGINTSSPASTLDVNGTITANGSFYQEDATTGGDDAQDKTIEFNRRGVFLLLISFSLGTTTTDVNRNVYSLGLFISRSNGATWVPIQQDLTSTHVGNLTISDASARGKLRIQKSSGSDNRICAFRIDVLSSADVAITVTDT